MPSSEHRSPVVLGVEPPVVEEGLTVCEGGGPEAGVEDEGHPMPNKAHKSPVVLGGELSVVEGS